MKTTRHLLKINLFVAALLLGVGCAHKPVQKTEVQEGGVPFAEYTTEPESSTEDELARSPVIDPPESFSGKWIISGIEIKNTEFDLPVQLNTLVEKWVHYSTTGKGRKYFELYLRRSEYFVPYIVPLLKENGLPEDLVYLAMIESGFNNHARSHAKAVGPWQFIQGTGKRYGLKVNWWVDERRNVEKSTIAAIRYLKELHTIFRSWELAAAGYNAGEAKVARAIRRFQTNDFWAIARQRFFKPETRNYVPKMFAAAIVAKNRTLFGFPEKFENEPESSQPVASSEPAPEEVVLEEVLTAEDPDAGPPSEDMLPAVLAGTDDEAEAMEDEGVINLVRATPTPHISKDGSGILKEKTIQFEVQAPADLLQIAKAAQLSYQTVKNLNPELLRWCTPPGHKTYRVRLPVSAKERFLSVYNHPAFPRKVEYRKYKVRPGETLRHIAQRFGISIEPLKDLNGIRHAHQLPAGKTILLPMPSDHTRSIASLDIRDTYSKRKPRKKSGPRGKVKSVSYQERLKVAESARPDNS